MTNLKLTVISFAYFLFNSESSLSLCLINSFASLVFSCPCDSSLLPNCFHPSCFQIICSVCIYSPVSLLVLVSSTDHSLWCLSVFVPRWTTFCGITFSCPSCWSSLLVWISLDYFAYFLQHPMFSVNCTELNLIISYCLAPYCVHLSPLSVFSLFLGCVLQKKNRLGRKCCIVGCL